MKGLPSLLGIGPGLGGGDPLRGHLHGRLLLERHSIDHIAQFVIPAPSLRCGRPYLRARAPQAEGAIPDDALGSPQPARPDVAQHHRPALRRLARATLHRQHHLRAIRLAAAHDRERGLRRLETRLHVDPVGPHVRQFRRGLIPLLPCRVLRLPRRDCVRHA